MISRQRCNNVRANHLRTEIESTWAFDNSKAAWEKEDAVIAIAHQDIAERERFLDLFEELARREPCNIRASLTRREIDDILAVTRTQIVQMRDFLTDKKTERRGL